SVNVTGLDPTTGPSIGGTTVVITGTGFLGATAVYFGANPATSFNVDSNTQITAIDPAGTGVVDVTVTNGTTSFTSPADQFTYAVAPTVTDFTVNGNTPELAGPQRSRVVDVTITFDQAVNLDSDAVMLTLRSFTNNGAGVIGPGVIPTLTLNTYD